MRVLSSVPAPWNNKRYWLVYQLWKIIQGTHASTFLVARYCIVVGGCGERISALLQSIMISRRNPSNFREEPTQWTEVRTSYVNRARKTLSVSSRRLRAISPLRETTSPLAPNLLEAPNQLLHPTIFYTTGKVRVPKRWHLAILPQDPMSMMRGSQAFGWSLSAKMGSLLSN